MAAEVIEKYGVHRAVIDPVMVCKGENDVLHPENKGSPRPPVPKATVVTPNLFEASQLADSEPITTLEEMKQARPFIISARLTF